MTQTAVRPEAFAHAGGGATRALAAHASQNIGEGVSIDQQGTAVQTIEGPAQRKASAGEARSAAKRRREGKQLLERIKIPERLHELVMQQMPRYHWVVLGRSNATETHVEVLEVAVSFHRNLSAHVRRVDNFEPCKGLRDPDPAAIHHPELNFA